VSISSELLIRDYAKRLKLPAVASSAERLAQEAAAAGHGHLEFLAALLAAEVSQRESNVERARIKAARFPELKELADFDFSLVPSLNAPLVAELARGAWIERREVVLAVGTAPRSHLVPPPRELPDRAPLLGVRRGWAHCRTAARRQW
jgi:DNA replication protein DnaC